MPVPDGHSKAASKDNKNECTSRGSTNEGSKVASAKGGTKEATRGTTNGAAGSIAGTTAATRGTTNGAAAATRGIKAASRGNTRGGTKAAPEGTAKQPAKTGKKKAPKQPAEEDWEWLQPGFFIHGWGPEFDDSSTAEHGTNLSENEIAKLTDVEREAYMEAPRKGGWLGASQDVWNFPNRKVMAEQGVESPVQKGVSYCRRRSGREGVQRRSVSRLRGDKSKA